MDSSPSHSSSRSVGSTAKGLPARTSHRLRRCSHNREAILLVARTSKNNGRSFYRCPYWEDSTTDCGYFKWTDEKPKVNYGLSTKNDIVSYLDVPVDKLRSMRVTLERVQREIRVLLLLVSFLGLCIAYGYRL
ncbi:hypothetical protein LINPERPRIM_LOCUS30295 [Linum perenne]